MPNPTEQRDSNHDERMRAFRQLPKAQQLVLLKLLGEDGPHKAKAFGPEEVREFEAAHRMWDWYVQQASDT
jgi:hypothetical protein